MKMSSPICEEYKLTYMEFTVLMFLGNHPQYDTATEIVKFRHLTKSHVSISVKSLLDKELLCEFYKENNSKTKHLKLTEKSKGIFRKGQKMQKEFVDILTEGFTEGEVEAWKSSLKKIDQNINNYLSK